MTHIGVAVIVGQRTLADALASRITAEPDLSVVAVADSVAAARRLLEGRHADVVLLDSELPDGLDFAAELDRTRATRPLPTHVVMLGPISEATHVVEALRTEVTGWVPKEESIEYLLCGIRGVMRGEIWLPAAALGPVLRLLLHERYEREDCPEHPLERLTPREREVLDYLVEGIGRREAAERMHLSAHTVRSHLQNLMGKLGVHTTLEAVAVARQAQFGEARPRAVPCRGDGRARHTKPL
jgi:DNA-binding NarL/FixJ family response regulator